MSGSVDSRGGAVFSFRVAAPRPVPARLHRRLSITSKAAPRAEGRYKERHHTGDKEAHIGNSHRIAPNSVYRLPDDQRSEWRKQNKEVEVKSRQSKSSLFPGTTRGIVVQVAAIVAKADTVEKRPSDELKLFVVYLVRITKDVKLSRIFPCALPFLLRTLVCLLTKQECVRVAASPRSAVLGVNSRQLPSLTWPRQSAL